MRPANALLFIAAFTLACGDSSPGVTGAPAGLPESAADEVSANEFRSLGQGAGSGQSTESPSAPPAPVAANGSNPSSAPSASNAPNMIIRNGSASVEVDSLEPAIAAIRALVARVGGYVGNTALQAGNESIRSATLELRIPAERFDQVVGGLDPVGEVEYVNVNAEDVGEQYMDLEARAANARRLESRLVELLAARTGKLADVLAVERELSRVREEIERIDGRMRWLRTRAAMSSLTVSVHEPGPIVGRPGDHPIADAFRQAWRNAVAFFAWVIAASGIFVPVAVLAGVGVSLWRRGRRHQSPAIGYQPSAPPPADA